MKIFSPVFLICAIAAMLLISAPDASARHGKTCPNSGVGWDGQYHCNLTKWNAKHPHHHAMKKKKKH
jgi:hypothetical protein